MRAFMTNGTLEFLKKYVTKHPAIDFRFMDNSASTLVYYENRNDKGVFSSGRVYDVVQSSGAIQQSGYVVMNNIPVSEEGSPVFEDRFKRRQGKIDTMSGFQAFRLLRPLQGNTYIVLTQWAEQKDYTNWKESIDFKQSHQNQQTKPPGYYTDKPFKMSYFMVEEDLL